MDLTLFVQSHHLHSVVYLLVFLLIVFDAALTVFGAMFLVVQGTLAIIPTVIVLFFGVLGEQLLWYYIGKNLRGWNRLMNWLDKPAKPFDKHLVDKPTRTLIISKFVYGIHRAMLVRAGMLHINFKKYVTIAIWSTVVWLGVIGLLGYMFSASYVALRKFVNYAELVPLVLIIIYFIVDWRISKRLKKEMN